MRPRTIRALRPAVAGALFAGGLGAGCAGGAPPATVAAPRPAEDECVLPGGDRAGQPPVLVAAGAPDDSLFLARQRVETPVRLDCRGQLRPGFAGSWSPGPDGRAWTLTVDPERAGGSAAALAAAWRSAPGAAAALRWSGVESVVPLDQRRLVVTFRTEHDSLPALFADAALGVSSDPAGAGVRVAVNGAGRDARDAIDQGAEVIRTADPAALEYAAGRNDLAIHALPWNLTYALMLPAGPWPILGADTSAVRATLARDAVRVAARGAEPPYWWETADCGARPATASSRPSRPGAILHSSDDAVARALAERLAATWQGEEVVVRGVPPAELTRALRGGADRGYVVALPRRALVPCREMAAWPRDAGILALIDTRAHVILWSGVPALEVDYDGTLRPAGPR